MGAELVEQVVGKSQRETDHLLATLAPQTFKKERIRPISEELTELRIALNKDQMAVLEKARAKFSHRATGWAELLEILAGEALKDPKPRTVTSAPKLHSRYIPRAIKCDRFSSAGHRCEFVDAKSKRRCEAAHFLEVDHIKPLGLGGTTTSENLRVLCRTHNQWHALRSFGSAKMRRHWGREYLSEAFRVASEGEAQISH